MDRLPLTDKPDHPPDTYQAARSDNAEFILDMLEAMRFEAELVGDGNSARLWEGIIHVISAFRIENPARQHVLSSTR